MSEKIDFFKFDLKADKQQKAFDDTYKKNNGNWSAIKSALTEVEGFTPAVINNLEFTHHLAEWSKDNKDLIAVFQKDKHLNSMRDIAAKLNKAAFIEKVQDAAPAESEEEKKAFALNLHRELFRLEPTAMLVNMVKDPKVPILNDAIGAQVAAVLEKQPDFNIKTTSVYEVIKNEAALKDVPVEIHEAVKTQLKTLQRLAAVAPDPEALPVLYNAKLHTALQISAIPQAQFVSAMSNSGLDDNTLMQIHSNAQQARVRNEQAIMALIEAGKGTGVAMIDKGMSIAPAAKAETMSLKVSARAETKAVVEAETPASALQEILAKHNLSWDLLFGDADFCECGECNSVYSATAYFVELLQYLRNNNLDPNATGPLAIKNEDSKDISGTPLEKLFARRPDLGCLELTCKNTNIILPYVDLVNEVMENYVAFKHLKPFNVADETSGELLAEPHHTEYQAYCILKNAVYPFTLPYHQPIDAARIYLKHLDTSRHELMDTFRKNNVSKDDELTRLKDEALDRATDAEFLGLTKEEYVILTKKCFESKALMEKLKNKTFTDGDYQQLIGVKKPVSQYYGYDDDATMLGEAGLALIKKEFLRRTGIDYFNLVDLLKTGYLNPLMPKGKSKTIMESLRFSYRFLQNYAKVHGIDRMAEELVKGEKFADLSPLLNEKLFPDKEALNCPNPAKEHSEVTDKDIIRWAKCHFEKVGKVIVIESGRGCVNGIISSNQKEDPNQKLIVKNCKIYIEVPHEGPEAGIESREIGSIDKETGKITPKDAPEPMTSSDIDEIKNALFIGDRGEKGILQLIDNEVYLVLVEQKDSCDLDTALLQHLDGTPLTVEEYDRIQRFIRLWRKLGWTIDETDQAIVGFSKTNTQDIKAEDSLCDDCNEDECNGADCDDCEEDITSHKHYQINPDLIHQLVAVKKLLDKTGLELVKLLSFWSHISTAGEKSLYQRLFLTHNILGIDKIFKADDRGNYLTADAKLLDHSPAVMAALNLSADDIQAIKLATGMEDKLTLDNLSKLYKHRLLSKALGLRIPAFVAVLPLFGKVFQDAHATFEFIERWAKMEDAGFTHQQLNYIINGVDDEKKPFAPSQKAILQLAKTLYDGLNAIEEAHKDLQADGSITDSKLQKINIQNQANTELVRTKTSLLFETGTVEKIIGTLEGTNVFTANAPKNLDFTLPDANTLKNKINYDKTKGKIQITGILTEDEVNDYKNLGNSEWGNALTPIQKRQEKLFKELFSGILETKTEDEKKEFEAIIKAGDVSIPADKIPEGQPDTNTAPKKRAAFLAVFLPYLRQQLTHRFVIETLANFTELEAKITEVLVSEVLKKDEKPIYGIFEKIKESGKPDESSGYLIPATDAGYTFVARDSKAAPAISLDGVALNFTRQEDPDQENPDNEWWSEATQLQAGKLYKLATSGVGLKNIFWKTPVSAITPIPSSALIPDFASEQCEPALIALRKAAILVSTFDLSADEIRFFNLNAKDFEDLDFNKLSLSHWLRLEAYVRLRNSLPEEKLNMLGFWNWVYDPASKGTQLIDKIIELTTWKKERIGKLIAENHFNVAKLEDYRNEKSLLKLQKALTVADKIGMDIDLLFDWAIPTSNFNKCRKTADSIKNAIRAKYNQTDWEQVVKPLQDQLRNNQKEALIGYLLQQKELIAWNVTDADGLFEYFLIDVQMDACMETSRIKQAISSVQLFVQRCFLGLEEEHNGIKPDILDRSRWDWVQRYRVWEANRKVFLYPENWIESNLRDDKSPFFKELESELLQKDINKQNVTDALKAYLYKVDEVANMEVVGLHIEMETDKDGNKQPVKLHVFSRTRNAPYFFYYRYFDILESNWYPWEKMQVDIPSYDVEDLKTHQITGNGCYLTPVVWNNRLLIFFPQIMKKTKPVDLPDKITTSKDNNGDTQVPVSKPIEYYEIKMAWSEFRNGKWTQKQLSKDAIFSEPIDDMNSIQYFKFVPVVSKGEVLILVDDNFDIDGTETNFRKIKYDGGYKGAFSFNGNSLTSKNAKGTDSMPIVYFNQFVPDAEGKDISSIDLSKRRMYSWQIDSSSLSRINTDIYFDEDSSKEILHGSDFSRTEFYHPSTQKLLGEVNRSQLEFFFKENLSMLEKDFGPFDHDNNADTPDIYHELKRPYSLYNWELFFHTPILLADALSKAQQFEEALKWFHYVFNPIADGADDKRFWQFAPFKAVNSKRILESIFNNLKPNTATSDKTINEWRNKPFMPHVVARNRPVAYMKWVVMKYIDNILDWGDYLFRQDTIESINQATQLYVLAGHILGPKPMMIPKRGKIKPQTYLDLLDKWDAFSNAMVELELAAPFSNQPTLPPSRVNNEIAFANIFGVASSLYFCMPNNPKLMGYWDTIADRLFKIRHCQNIEGIFRKLPLFEPAIDPALLVKAAAQGLSIASVLNDLNTPMPNYRFYYLLQKALELCNELKSLGGAMLSAIEKKDNETIALIRAKHEGGMQNLVMEIKKKQLEEAQKSLESLMQNRIAPAARMRYYLKLSGLEEKWVPSETTEFNGIPNEIVTVDREGGLKLIPAEKEDMDKASAAADWQIGIGVVETLAAIFHALPTMTGDGKPFGIGAGAFWGFPNIANAITSTSRGLKIYADHLSYQSSSAGKKGGFQRALQERIFQATTAGFEVTQIDKQITAQKIRISIANQEIENQQKAIDNANEVEEFLKNKYTNEELYTWMRGSLKTLYHQVYNLAYDLAKKAERTYCFERGISNANFIQSGYFDAGREGLLAGEQLYVGLKQLEAAYQEKRGYDYEITKHISLRQLDPLALLQLKATSECEFDLPEVLFDMDYPGHFKRRIKSVSVSIPCVAGPYTGVNATLRLLSNEFRNSSIANSYPKKTDEQDDRFVSYNIPITAIATSSAQNDAGTFELNFKDERYLPFEGAGVISKWRLELPTVKQFDYNTISDVVLHVKYIASEGGEQLKKSATSSVAALLNQISQQLNETGLHVPISLKHDMPNEWNLLKQNRLTKIKIDTSRLPYMAQTHPTIEDVMFVAKAKSEPATFVVSIEDTDTTLSKINDEWKLYKMAAISGIQLDTAFTLSVVSQNELDNLEELIMVIKYSFSTTQ